MKFLLFFLIESSWFEFNLFISWIYLNAFGSLGLHADRIWYSHQTNIIFSESLYHILKNENIKINPISLMQHVERSFFPLIKMWQFHILRKPYRCHLYTQNVDWCSKTGTHDLSKLSMHELLNKGLTLMCAQRIYWAKKNRASESRACMHERKALKN